jgi:uncharacterized protein YukE
MKSKTRRPKLEALGSARRWLRFAERARKGQVWVSQGRQFRAAGARASHRQTERDTMAQAIMDPEQVRRFAEELKRFNTDLKDKIVSLQARFSALGDTWQDQEHVKFAEEFKQTMKALKKFVEVSNQHTPYLLRKAQRIEEYLNQR